MEKGIVIDTRSPGHRHPGSAFQWSLIASAAVIICTAPFCLNSLMALLNRLFEASEQANRYVYTRFPVPEDTALLPGVCWLVGLLLLLIIGMYRIKRAWPALLCACAVAIAQAWIGLSLPAWCNVLLFGLLGMTAAIRISGTRGLGASVLCIFILCIMVMPSAAHIPAV